MGNNEIFSDEHNYVQRYEDISNKPEEKRPVSAKKKISKISIVMGVVVVALVIGIGEVILTQCKADNANMSYDSSLKNNSTYNIGYDDGYESKDFNSIYNQDQSYKKGYADGTKDANR